MVERLIFVSIGSFSAVAYAGLVAYVGLYFFSSLVKKLFSGLTVSEHLWLGFVFGQGLFGSVWMLIAVSGLFERWLLTLVIVALTAVTACRFSLEQFRLTGWAKRPQLSRWYCFLAVATLLVSCAYLAASVLPPTAADSLRSYLFAPLMIAETGSISVHSFAPPFFGLHPLLGGMHSAALYALCNECAVTFWDGLCSLSLVFGTFLIAKRVFGDVRAGLVAAVLVLSVPGMHNLIGEGKIDNAAAQFGVAAALLTIAPEKDSTKRWLVVGLLCGWLISCRVTDVVGLPVFAGMAVAFWLRQDVSKRVSWSVVGAFAVLGGLLAVGPSVLKNLVLVGCPLAPVFGCEGAFWADHLQGAHGGTGTSGNQQLLSFFLRPVWWVFADRGNFGGASAILLALPPLAFFSSRSTLRSSMWLFLPVLLWFGAWYVIQPPFLMLRWLTVPIALFAAGLSGLVVSAERDLILRYAVRGALCLTLAMMVVNGRSAYPGLKFATGFLPREEVYYRFPGWEVSQWLNREVGPGRRVALAGYRGLPYFLHPAVLAGAETATEAQALFEISDHRFTRSPRGAFERKDLLFTGDWKPDIWRFLDKCGFEYVVTTVGRMSMALDNLPDDLEITPSVVYVDDEHSVIRIERSDSQPQQSWINGSRPG